MNRKNIHIDLREKMLNDIEEDVLYEKIIRYKKRIQQENKIITLLVVVVLIVFFIVHFFK